MFSIVIVNYDGMPYLPQCLEAIRRQTYATAGSRSSPSTTVRPTARWTFSAASRMSK